MPGTPALIGPAIPAGVAIGGTYSASTTFVIPAADYGLPSNDYRFYSVGIDAAGLEEPMHTMYDAMIPDVSYSEPSASQLSLSSITVENGAAERSYIRYIDVNFNDATSGVLQAIINSVNNNTDPELSLTQYSLQDTGPGAPVSLQNMLHLVDNAIEIDFGTGGIEGDAGTNGADGYYALSFTPPANQGIGSTHDFYRLLGDVNGDGSVDARRPDGDRCGAGPVGEPDRHGDRPAGLGPDAFEHGRQWRRHRQHDRRGPGVRRQEQGQYSQEGIDTGMSERRSRRDPVPQ